MTLRRNLAASMLVGALGFTGGLTAAASAASAAPAASATSGAFSPAAASSPGGGEPGGASAAQTAAQNTAKAASVVRAAGYTPISLAGYDAGNDLSVIVGLLSTSGDGHPQRAFLFHHSTLVGYDAPQPSATIRWIWSTDREIALQYDLYRPGDPMCCPSAGGATVRFAWNGAGVSRLDPLPSADTSAVTSRR
ncbi:LppP/LprE lipoprotein [Frankia sp. AiPs1]|uniref:LppP/LprE family lipoprotein n=1 Tax=Frankia sp. AiPa1 TaxID=573492 RepID=UPI00202B9E32|nr:LppP/LprE family lipoprotein [Frankia sp. AiPa1]MCL9761390.1 LppP/LprE family lipoprotein [Frankia sp. AiPa1]